MQDMENDKDQELKRMMLGLEVRRVRCGAVTPGPTLQTAPFCHCMLAPCRFLLTLYYRTRLQKVERQAATLMADDDMAVRLSTCVAWMQLSAQQQ